MRFDPFEVSIPHIAYAVLGGFVVLFGMFSLFIREKLYVGEAIWAFVFGVAIGPYGANIFNPRGWGGGDPDTSDTITLEVTRVVLAIGVFAIGVELPKAYMQRHWKSLLFLLGPVMTWGWFVSGGLIYALIPGLNFLSSLVIAACLTPTDPILAAAVVGGKYADKHVPAHLRHLLAAESGCNDGAAFPFLFIALYLTTDSSTGKAISDWFLLLWLYQVIMGIVFGSLLGFGFRHLMKFCEHNDLIDRKSYVAQYVSLAMLTIGTTTLLGSDDLLAAFSCGTAFAWDGFFNKQTEESVFSSVIDLLFNIAAFVFVGAWMPFSDFSNAELTLSVWRLFVIAILVMILRRLPVVIALYRWIPDIKTFREAIFSGHFGPMGIGAVFISTLAAGQLPSPESPPQGQTQLLAASIQPIVAFMVLVSVAVHGLSIPFFTFGRRVHSVSRTWSRHDTFGTFGSRRRSIIPEWANQLHVVQPGEEIVINRDRDHGEQESITPVEGGSGSSHAEKHEDDATREKGERGGGNPPDGTETMAEWKEGQDKVIERREGPGAEVEVEVQRNAYGPSDTTTTSPGDAVHRVIEDIRNKMRHAPDELDRVLSEAEEGMRHGVEERAKEARNVAMQMLSPQTSTPPHKQGQGQGQEDEDEGWMSDRSAGEPAGSSDDAAAGAAAGAAGAKKQRGKSPRFKIPKPSRKRTSIRHGVLGQRPHTIHRSQSEDFTSRRASGEPNVHEHEHSGEGDEVPSGAQTPVEERRGRSSMLRVSGPSGTHTPTHLRPTHRRIDSIRSELPSREMSPARSVRFADAPTSPRIVTSPSSPHTPPTPILGGGGIQHQNSSESDSQNHSQSQSQTDAEQQQHQEDDSPRNMVRFSLPAPGETKHSHSHSHSHS